MTDRKLDALVAEKVMGWTRGGSKDHTRPKHASRKVQIDDEPAFVEDYLDYNRKGPHDRLTSPDKRHTVYLCGCRGEHDDDIPEYSTDIAAAWQVVEKMADSGFDLLLDWGKAPSAAFVPRNAAYAYDPAENAIRAYAATPPMAICLAALKAVSG